jgi:hypothetical protein
MKHSRDVSWLVAEGPYQDQANALCGRDPRLRRRDPKAVAQKTPWPDAKAWATVLEMDAENKSADAVQRREFLDAKDLDLHLDNHDLGSARGKGRVIILEGINPKFIAVLGRHFKMHPSIFVEHERVVVMNRNAHGESDGMPLPSVTRSRDHRTLKYYEPLEFSSMAPTSFRWVCGTTGRHIGVSRLDGRLTPVGVVRRKCSVWSRMRAAANGGGWDCVVICDPPVTSVRTGVDYRDSFNVTTKPYQGGYVDFIPQEEYDNHRVSGNNINSKESTGPPRTSMMDDLVYYLAQHAGLLHCARPDTSVGLVVNKIIASHYLKHYEHVRATLSYIQRGLSRKQDLKTLSMDQVEDLWSDIQAWERRMGEYCEDVESIMLQLGAANPDQLAMMAHHSQRRPSAAYAYLQGDRDGHSSDWMHSDRDDYQFLLTRFRDLRHRTEKLNSAITGLANIAGNRQAYKEQQLTLQEQKRSIREAKSTKAVTLLGLLFIPLAYTSSLFSMSEPFRPGDESFWIYFAASAPLVVLVLMGYYVLDWGYTDDGAAWSPQTFWQTTRARMTRRPGILSLSRVSSTNSNSTVLDGVKVVAG